MKEFVILGCGIVIGALGVAAFSRSAQLKNELIYLKMKEEKRREAELTANKGGV
jgi:hypothetical protein